MYVKLRLQPILTNVIYMMGTFLGLIALRYKPICDHVALHPVQTSAVKLIVSLRWLIHELVIIYKVSIPYLQIPKINVNLQNGSFQTETRPYVHRASSTLDQRSLTFTFGKLRDKRNNIQKRKQWIHFSENERHTNMFPNIDNYLSCC